MMEYFTRIQVAFEKVGSMYQLRYALMCTLHVRMFFRMFFFACMFVHLFCFSSILQIHVACFSFLTCVPYLYRGIVVYVADNKTNFKPFSKQR